MIELARVYWTPLFDNHRTFYVQGLSIHFCQTPFPTLLFRNKVENSMQKIDKLDKVDLLASVQEQNTTFNSIFKKGKVEIRMVSCQPAV